MAAAPFDREKRRLAQAVRARRASLGLSQEEAAHLVHMAPRHYQKLEAGELNVTLKTLVKISEAFRIPLRQIFE